MSLVRMSILTKTDTSSYSDKNLIVLQGQMMYLTTDRIKRSRAGDVAAWVALCDNKMTYRSGYNNHFHYADNWGRINRIAFCQ